MRRLVCLMAFIAFCGTAHAAAPIAPADVLVIYNRQVPESKALARHYAGLRGVPAQNLVAVAVPATESITFVRFDSDIVPPVQAAARRLLSAGRKPVLLAMYGVPLIVTTGGKGVPGDPGFEPRAQAKLAEARERLTRLLARIEGMVGLPPAPDPRNDDQLPARIRAATAQGALFIGRTPADGTRARDEMAELLRQLEGGPVTLADRERLTRLIFTGILPVNSGELERLVRASQGEDGVFGLWRAAALGHAQSDAQAAVDSELALILRDHQRPGRLANPFRPAFDPMPGIEPVRDTTLMTARLDGPDPESVRRMMDDAVAAERAGGPRGTAYIDARGLKGDSAYPRFDQSLGRLAGDLRRDGRFPVVFDNTPALFAPGVAPQAALYAGWYSLAKYVPAFTWVPGSVGYHVASGEARSLRHGDFWCRRMIQDGIAATLGPVGEPYLEAFPDPEAFFGLLLGGSEPLVAVWFKTLPDLSWRMTLLGDPLYTPFAPAPAPDPPRL